MKAIIAWLSGKKSIIGSIALGVIGVLYANGMLTQQQAEAAGLILAALTGIAFRLAIAKKG